MIKKRLIQLLSHAKKYIVFQIIWQWLGLLCQVMIVYGAAHLIERAFFGNLSVEVIIRYSAMIGSGIVLRIICDRQSSYASFEASVDVKRILRARIYDKLIKLGGSYRSKVSTSEIVQVTGEGVEQLEIYFGRYLPQFFYAFIAPLTLFAILAFVNVSASIVLLVCVPLIPATIVAVQKIAKRLLSKYWGIYTGLGDSFLENLHGLTTLKIYKADGVRSEQMDDESEKFRRITMKVLTMQLNSISVMDIVAYGGAAIGIIVAIVQFNHGYITLAGIIMIVLLAAEFFIPMRILGSFFHIAMNGMAASDKIFALLDLPETDGADKVLEGEALNIVIADLSFAYGEKEILRGLDLEFPKGSFTSIVGTSGCGKSTIAGILTGKNKGYSGSVKIGNIELSEISETSLMKNITLVTHDSYLFKGSVRDNLLMGKADASDEEMRRVLESVNLADFLGANEGLETGLLDKAGNLSGGQRQRLALARALLHDTPIYIFDEATSNIDVESEENIMEVIHNLAVSEKTVILISHRLANVVGSDNIYMLSEGKIAESGKHTDLINNNGEYMKLFSRQKALENYSNAEDIEDGRAVMQDG